MKKFHGIQINEKKISGFCRRNGIRKLSLFGSLLGNDFGEESDIDILVEFEKESIPGLMALNRMERELSDLFDGRKVDLRTPMDLSRYFRQDVISRSVTIFAAS
jgi:hypothetical protein